MRKSSGFTLIELMIVVGIIGILASVALPTFSAYKEDVMRSEASEVLAAMHQGWTAYYMTEQVLGQGITGQTAMYCCPHQDDTVPDVNLFMSANPSDKMIGNWGSDAGYTAMGMTGTDAYWHIYASFHCGFSEASHCGPKPAENSMVNQMIAIRRVSADTVVVGFLNEYFVHDDVMREPGIVWMGPMPLSDLFH